MSEAVVRTSHSSRPSDDHLTGQPREEFTAGWEEWHRAHEARRADQHGFLAITGLHWLTSDPQRFGDAPGAWSAGPDGVEVDLGDEKVTIDGETVSGRHSFGVLPERGGVSVTWKDAVIEVAKRGGNDIVRPRHPGSEVLAAYHGTSAFEADPRWAVTGRYVPFDAPRPTPVGSVVDGLEHVYDAPGRIEFGAGGHDLALTAFPGHTPGSLFVLFKDQTSGVTTYAANRSLEVPPPAADGTVVLDFNRAVNLPCAYTTFATCPLPPAENNLPIAVEAGEQKPGA
jgi:hypothetical protein